MASFTDDFNDAGLTGWTLVSGSWDNSGTGQIIIPTRSPDGSGTAWIRFNSALDTKDHSSQIDYTVQDGPFAFLGPAVNVDDASKSGYYGNVRSASSVSSINKMLNGSTTTLINTALGTAPPFSVKLQRDGDFLTLYKNGVSLASYEIIASPLNHLRTGLSGHPSVGATGDNFIAQDLLVAPTLTLTSITPTTGPSTGGTTVTIYGSGFLSGTPEPRFNGVLATDVAVVNDTELTCVTPAL